MALYRLQRSGRGNTQFSMAPTGQKHAFLNIEEVLFNQPEAPQYRVEQVTHIAKMRL